MSSADTTRIARHVADGCLVAIGVFTVAHIAFGPAAGTINDHGVEGIISFVALYLVVGVYAWIGWMIVVRQPGNTIGWLLLVAPILATLAFANGDYANLALVKHPGTLPFGDAAAWLIVG